MWIVDIIFSNYSRFHVVNVSSAILTAENAEKPVNIFKSFN